LKIKVIDAQGPKRNIDLVAHRAFGALPAESAVGGVSRRTRNDGTAVFPGVDSDIPYRVLIRGGNAPSGAKVFVVPSCDGGPVVIRLTPHGPIIDR
ncbi:MAG TPA: hypothetical protein VFU59_06780, partial [Candidatus Eisenbacteria bacterium]|nr:hypothetical protein [Candidatus Eisenbacteria bacterium]